MVGRILPRGVRLAVHVTALLAVTAAGATADAQLDQAVGQRIERNQARVSSQKKIDQYSDESDRLAAEYRSALQQIDSLRVYNRQISGLIASQLAEMASLRDQVDNVELVGRQVTPLMFEMIDALGSFVELDVPFLLDERTQRVEVLRDLMARADITNSERYRRIVEAYQIENEYGRTIEAYKGELENDGRSLTVDFLRIGRVVLLYQTLDGSETGAWDQRQGAWIPAADYQSSVRQGLRIARKQAAPDLLRLPVPAAEHGSERAAETAQ